jgi:hypothetical protein
MSAVPETDSTRVGTARLPTPAQLYCWIWGIALVVLGAGSLLVNPNFGVGDDVKGEALFGSVVTNGWHGLAGLSAGLVAVAFARSRRWSALVAAGVAVIGGIVPAIIFFLAGDGEVALGIIPVDITDAVLLHLVPGIVGVLCALAPSSRLASAES